MLSNFSLPVSLGELKEFFSDEVRLDLKPAFANFCSPYQENFTVLSPLKDCADAASNVLYVCYILLTSQAVHCSGYSLHTLVIVSHAAGNSEGCLAGAASADHSGI